MNLLTPTALALLALAIPILLLWMLKLRRREVTVPSTMLWRRLVRDREANAPWQKLRRNLLLLLQLAILAALVLALARPYRPVPAVASGAVVVLLDGSASMKATDVAPSRFAVAQRAATELADRLGNDGIMTVILVSHQPRVLAAATNDRAALRDAIASAQAGEAPADWAAAFALAAGAARGAAESAIVIISDGQLPADLPALPGEVRYIPVGREGGSDNLSISALATRSEVSGLELFAGVTNTSPPGSPLVESLLAIYLDGELYDSRRITVIPGETLPLIFAVPAESTSVIEARLTAEDALQLDNRAWTVCQLSGPRRTLLVTPGNLFLEQALAAMPGMAAFRSRPDAPLPLEDYDLVVLDSAAPPEVPAGPLLIINPLAGGPLLTVSGTFSDTGLSRVANDPLLTHVDFGQVQIRQAQAVERPSWARELVGAQGGPLLLAGEVDGRRVAALTFDLHQSDLPLQIAFPVLMANLVEWLVPGLAFDAADGLYPGEPLAILGATRADQVAEVRVTRPDGQVWTADVAAELARSPQLVFAETEKLGLYRVELDGEPAGQFAVNLFDPAESDLTRREIITIGRAEVAPAAEEQALGQQPLWPWLIAAGLLLLLFEWWVYHRGTRFRKPGHPAES